MGMRKAKEQQQARSAEAKKPDAATFLAPDGSTTNDSGENNTPQDRPRINQRTRRTFFDTSALGPVSPFSTHRAQYEATPQAQAKRATEVAAKRDEQTARAITGLEWLMSKLTSGK